MTERLQTLNQVILQCKNSTFYRNRLPSEPLASLDELKQLPLTTPADVKKNSPLGFICVNKKELFQYHETFGTTGIPASTWLTREDLLDNAREVNESGINFTEDDTVLIRFPYAISAIAHVMHTAAQMKNACVIPVSSRSTISPFPRVVDMLKRLEVTVLAGLPLQALQIAEAAELMGFKPDRDFPNLRAILTAGEPLTTGRRKLLESIWGVPVIDIYGMAEIGTAITDCQYGRGHLLEDYFIFELLDEDLKTEVKPGQLGYLVVTTLRKRANPVIRYLTGDRAKKIDVKCQCGKPFSIEVHGRKDDVIKLGDKVFDLWDIEDIVADFPCRRFWVAGPYREGLQFVVEEEKPGDRIDSKLIKQLENKYSLKLDVEVVPKGTLYDRSELLSVGAVGKPRYLYSAAEMYEKVYQSIGK